MPVRASLPVVLLLTAAVALLAASAISPAAAAADKHGGGRMVIIRAPPGTTTSAAAASGDRSRWRVEDEVAPEFAGLLGGDDHTSSGALIQGKAVCIVHCGGDGKSYTRPCTYGTLCNGG